MNTNALQHEGEMIESEKRKVFGVWIYIMSDCILFAALFATYVVLRHNTFGGPSASELFDLPFVLIETFLLLTSSLTYGLSMLAADKQNTRAVLAWLMATFLLGACFVGMEVYEFRHLILSGHGPGTSAFLSAFFGLVGTHGLHVSVGLLWMLGLIFQIGQRGVTLVTARKLTCLGLFWHFLDIVWIFIFTIVYLMGAL
jgi:cytochrome o ubiquinol oxidase subunit 3